MSDDDAKRLREAQDALDAALRAFIAARDRLRQIRRELDVRENLPMMGEE